MNEETLESIAEKAARKVLDEMRERDHPSGWPDKDTHRAHHRYIEKEIADGDEFKTRRQRVVDHIIGGAGIIGIVAFIGFIGHMAIKILGEFVRGVSVP